jgi:hypothetical protein
VQELSALEIEALHQLARQDQAVGIANSFDFDLHGAVLAPMRRVAFI